MRVRSRRERLARILRISMSVQGRTMMVRAAPLSGLALALMGSYLYSATPALAQSSTTATPAEAIALYQGRDREQKLMEGARKEGGFNLYTSMIGPDQDALTEAFT